MAALQKKRTRVCRGQSKNGCYTCKSRKIKCDEAKPHCQRCQRARVECGGYPLTANDSTFSGHNSLSVLTPPDSHDDRSCSPYAFSSDRGYSPIQDPFTQAGLNLLLDSYSDHFVLGQRAMRKLLRAVQQSPSVAAACGALGTASEFQRQPNEGILFMFGARYGEAIRLLREETEAETINPTHVFACCTLLACTELLLRRRRNAWDHFRGSFQAVHARTFGMSMPVDGYLWPLLGTADNPTFDSDMDHLFRVFDIQSQSWSQGARLPAIEPIAFDRLFIPSQYHDDMDTFDKHFVNMLHSNIVFEAIVARREANGLPWTELKIEVGRHISMLSVWVNLLDEMVRSTDAISTYIHFLMLRNFCLARYIKMSTLLSTYECAWDAHEDAFRQIIAGAEMILDYRNRTSTPSHAPYTHGFTPLLGVVQPIFLAATKYRDRSWRRRAVECLRKTGREGPWCGTIAAATATRCIDIEEAGSVFHATADALGYPGSEDPSKISMTSGGRSSILEHDRISLFDIADDNGEVDGRPIPDAETTTIVVKFYKRLRPVSALAGQIASHGKIDSQRGMPGISRQAVFDEVCWEKWEERLEVGTGASYKVLSSTRWSVLSGEAGIF